MALHGNGVGALSGGLHGALLGLLAPNRLRGSQRVGHLAYRVDHGRVVTLDGGVQISRTTAQIGAQSTPIKERQAQGWPETPLLAAGAKEAVQTDAGRTGKRHQVDAWIELAACAADILQRRLNTPARRCDVGTPTQQIRRHGLRQRRALQAGLRRHGEFQSLCRLPCQSIDSMLGQLDLFLQCFDLLAGFGHGAFALPHLQTCVQTRLETLLYQSEAMFALRQHPPCNR